jgi:putative phage-type endonuclease
MEAYDILIDTDDETAWLKARKRVLTASDMAAVLGLNPWKSALDVYLDKQGPSEPREDNDAMWWGRHLEGKIAEAYSDGKYSGRPIRRVGKHKYVLLVSRKYPYLAATLDFLTLIGDRWVPCEIKNTRRGEDWDEGAPIYHLVQLQQQILVIETGMGSIAGLLAGNRLVWQDVEADPELRARIIAEGADFMRMVDECEPPMPDASVSAGKALLALYPNEQPGEIVELDQGAVEWDTEILDVQARIKELNAREQQLKNNFMAAIGDAEKGILPGGIGAWKWATRAACEYVVKKEPARVLRRVKK